MHVADFLPPLPTVRVELNRVHIDDFLRPPPTVEVDGGYAGDLRPLGDFPPTPTVGQCVQPTTSAPLSVSPVPPTPPVAKAQMAAVVLL